MNCQSLGVGFVDNRILFATLALFNGFLMVPDPFRGKVCCVLTFAGHVLKYAIDIALEIE